MFGCNGALCVNQDGEKAIKLSGINVYVICKAKTTALREVSWKTNEPLGWVATKSRRVSSLDFNHSGRRL